MKAFSKHPKTVLVAIAGKEVDRLESLSVEFNVATTASDWQDLVADPNIDIISIATPNSLHHPIAVAALKAGKHVFCEKPLSITAEQAQEMVAAASANNRILEVAFNYRRRQDIGMGSKPGCFGQTRPRLPLPSQLEETSRHPRFEIMVHFCRTGRRRCGNRSGATHR
jgi:hypothetical protein